MASDFHNSPFYDVIRQANTAKFHDLVQNSDTPETPLEGVVKINKRKSNLAVNFGDRERSRSSSSESSDTKPRQLADLQLFDPASKYGTFLHLAVESKCAPEVIEGLITHGCPISHRNLERLSFMDVVMRSDYPHKLHVSQLVSKHVLRAVKEGDVEVIRELTRDTWTYWPVCGIPEVDHLPEAPEYLRDIVFPELKTTSQGIEIFEEDYKFGHLYKNAFGMEQHVFAIIRPTDFLNQLFSKFDSLREHDKIDLAKSSRASGQTKEKAGHKPSNMDDSEDNNVLDESSEENYWKDSLPDMYAQDTMDRTPLHYICAHDKLKPKEITKLHKMLTRMHFDVKDKKGLTPMDYLEKRAKLDVKGVYDLILATERFNCLAENYAGWSLSVLGMKNELSDEKKEYPSALTEPRFPSGFVLPQYHWLLTIQDATGRSLVHKAVIYDRVDIIHYILLQQEEGKSELRTHKDAYYRECKCPGAGWDCALQQIKEPCYSEMTYLLQWGRTIYHYAHMFGHTALVDQLMRYKVKKERDIVAAGNCRDIDGKRPEDYKTSGAHAQATRKRVRDTVSILTNYHMLMINEGADKYRKKMYWVRDIHTGLLLHSTALKNHDVATLRELAREMTPAEWYTTTDVFGKTPLDYLELPDGTPEEKVDKFLKDLERKDDIKIRARIPAEVAELMDKDKAVTRNEYFKFHTVSNPNRPTTPGLIDSISGRSQAATGESMPADTGQAKLEVSQKGESKTKADDSPFDAQYLQQVLGESLMEALADVTLTRPADPIEHLAMYLSNYAHNQSLKQQFAEELRLLELERSLAAREEQRAEVQGIERRQLQKLSKHSDTTATMGIHVIAEET